jgi:hypothetical protein
MMAKITTWLSLYKVLHELPLYSILALYLYQSAGTVQVQYPF